MMSGRQNFKKFQRQSAFTCIKEWLRARNVTGIQIEEKYRGLLRVGLIIFCENCLFCHTDEAFFDIDHLVPDSLFKIWGVHERAGLALNMAVLCKSRAKGDLGCNQSKGANFYVPKGRGLAYTKRHVDMNCMPVECRPFDFAK